MTTDITRRKHYRGWKLFTMASRLTVIAIFCLLGSVLSEYAKQELPRKELGQLCDTPACKERYMKRQKNPFHPITVKTARAANQFAMDLHRQLIATSPDANMFYSPFSMSLAFGMLQSGAAGETKREIDDVFNWNSLAMSTDLSLGQLAREVQQTNSDRFHLANRVWIDQTERTLAKYKMRLKKNYDSPVGEVDFVGQPSAIERHINEWVAYKTHGMIRSLLPSGSVNAATRMILINVIYFKSAWLNAFEPKETAKERFKLADGGSVRVPMMTQTGNFHHMFDDERGCQVLRLPYADEDYSMILVLPFSVSGLNAVEKGLDTSTLSYWYSRMYSRRMTVHLPTFKMTHHLDLKPILQEMGMRSTFSSSANFSRVSMDKGLFVDEALHKAAIEVNEKGTEAAAATAIFKGRTFVWSFKANRPFLFYIAESTSGAILFSGRITDPSHLN